MREPTPDRPDTPPVQDRGYHAIYRHLALTEFGWETTLGLNLAFYRTFAVPAIATTLAATGEMTGRTQKRADDTGLLMYELIHHGFDHPHGRAVVRRLNHIHHRFTITNDDYRYVLATFAIVPTRFIDRYGHRPLTTAERDATHAFYRELGRRMNIADIPDTYQAMETFLDDYEAQHFAHDPAGTVLIDATRTLLADRFPTWARRAASIFGDALLDKPLRRALGISEPPLVVRGGVHLLLRARAVTVRVLRRPRRPVFQPGQPTKTYPDGYTIEELGPAEPQGPTRPHTYE